MSLSVDRQQGEENRWAEQMLFGELGWDEGEGGSQVTWLQVEVDSMPTRVQVRTCDVIAHLTPLGTAIKLYHGIAQQV